MKFKDMPYERPDIKKTLDFIDEINEKMQNAKSCNEILALLKTYDNAKKDFSTLYNLCFVRHTIDTKNEFYEKENEFFDENLPLVSSKSVEISKTLINSPLRSELEGKIGHHFFKLKECSLVLNEKAIPFMQKDNALISEYNKLIANSQIQFRGKTYTITQMAPLLQNTDREFRKEAYQSMNKFFESHLEDFDRIYDEMVKTRTEMAHALGYNSFTELQYKLLNRTDYNPKDVAIYREKILKYITPIAVKLRKIQAKRLGIKDFKFYDKPLDYIDGNSKPNGDVNFIIENAKKMYNELSPETGEFFNFMVDNELMDLLSKPGKNAGGYCTSFDKYKSPFIFSNFNGSNGDIQVITHEAGHAFQNYMSQNIPLSDYIWPTYEACEIHSMSMEFLTWPWMELFFGENANKFKYSALKDAICFLPYGVTIDHFQHFVYENPNATPEERRTKFHEIETMYQPDLDYDDDFMNKGTYWFKQGHVFSSPFYYIDYTLAQVCAFQYLIKYIENKEQALDEYITLCKAGGSKSFFDLIEIGKLENPMTTSVLEDIAPKLEKILDSIDI